MIEQQGAQFIANKNPKLPWKKGPQRATEIHNRRKPAEYVNPKNKKDKTKRMDIYFKRVQRLLFDELNPKKREKNLKMITEPFLESAIIRIENFPEEQFDLGVRLQRERGRQIELTPEIRAETIFGTQNDQKESLREWTDYFSSNDAHYPVWFKYYVLQNVARLRSFDYENSLFMERDEETTSLFPAIDRAALSKVYEVLHGKYPIDNTGLEDLIKKGNFAKLYAYFYVEEIKIQKEVKEEGETLDLTIGEWVPYKQNSEDDAQSLATSIKKTPWCTKGIETARSYLSGGDYYVRFANDKDGKPTIPVIAISMLNGQVEEVRGVLGGTSQELHTELIDVAKEKIESLPGGDKYEKKVLDMKKMTFLHWKNSLNKSDLEIEKLKERLMQESFALFGLEDKSLEFSQLQLMFLYETEHLIEGFGYKKDPRIKEIRTNRNVQEDAPIVLGVKLTEISWNKDDINNDTKVYIGPLYLDCFIDLSDVKKIYISFPDREALIGEIETGIGSRSELLSELELRGIHVSKDVLKMVKNRGFLKDIYQRPQPFLNDKLIRFSATVKTIRLSIKEMGFTESSTVAEVYDRAKELGLNLCPHEVILEYCLQNSDVPIQTDFIFATAPMKTSEQSSLVRLSHNEDGIELINTTYDYEYGPGYISRQNTDQNFLFSIP